MISSLFGEAHLNDLPDVRPSTLRLSNLESLANCSSRSCPGQCPLLPLTTSKRCPGIDFSGLSQFDGRFRRDLRAFDLFVASNTKRQDKDAEHQCSSSPIANELLGKEKVRSGPSRHAVAILPRHALVHVQTTRDIKCKGTRASVAQLIGMRSAKATVTTLCVETSHDVESTMKKFEYFKKMQPMNLGSETAAVFLYK